MAMREIELTRQCRDPPGEFDIYFEGQEAIK